MFTDFRLTGFSLYDNSVYLRFSFSVSSLYRGSLLEKLSELRWGGFVVELSVNKGGTSYASVDVSYSDLHVSPISPHSDKTVFLFDVNLFHPPKGDCVATVYSKFVNQTEKIGEFQLLDNNLIAIDGGHDYRKQRKELLFNIFYSGTKFYNIYSNVISDMFVKHGELLFLFFEKIIKKDLVTVRSDFYEDGKISVFVKQKIQDPDVRVYLSGISIFVDGAIVENRQVEEKIAIDEEKQVDVDFVMFGKEIKNIQLYLCFDVDYYKYYGCSNKIITKSKEYITYLDTFINTRSYGLDTFIVNPNIFSSEIVEIERITSEICNLFSCFSSFFGESIFDIYLIKQSLDIRRNSVFKIKSDLEYIVSMFSVFMEECSVSRYLGNNCVVYEHKIGVK